MQRVCSRVPLRETALGVPVTELSAEGPVLPLESWVPWEVPATRNR